MAIQFSFFFGLCGRSRAALPHGLPLAAGSSPAPIASHKTFSDIAPLLSFNSSSFYMCHRAECGGGLSMFVDGFNVAEQLARLQPELFSLLSSIPLEFIEEGYDVHTLMDGSQERFDFDMVSRHKTFKLDDRGRVVKVQFGNVMRSWFIDLADTLLVQQIYDGLKLFTELCYSKDNQLVFPLQNGDTVLWANTRLLHARSAYKLVGNPARERRVVGCYFAWDVVKSRIRLLRDQLNLPENQPSL